MVNQAPYKLVVLISGNGSNLQAIIDCIEQREINGVIAAVISNKADAYGLERAKKHNIDAVVIDHKGYEDRESYDTALSKLIDEANPDFIILAGYMRIMTPELVNRYLGKMVNIHPSLLPKYKGLNTHQRAIENGDSTHGLSVHFVTPELDGGPVIVQASVPIFSDDDATKLANRVQTQERVVYPLVVQWLCNGRLKMLDNHAYFDDQRLPIEGVHYDNLQDNA